MIALIKQATALFQIQRRAPVVPAMHTPAFPELAKGKACYFRDSVTQASWLVSFDRHAGTYYCQPAGNTKLIRKPYICYELDPRLVPAGTGLH